MSRPGPSRAARIERRALERRELADKRGPSKPMTVPESLPAAVQRCPNCAPGYDCERGIYTQAVDRG